ncbi:MAG: hypothetical protein LBV64_06380, partial [Mediterranea sp.]|nr:hypothetical protein [Mediterranea sp.]
FSNIASTYQTMAAFFDGAYTPKPHLVNNYNLLLKYNLNKAPVYFTMSEAEAYPLMWETFLKSKGAN